VLLVGRYINFKIDSRDGMARAGSLSCGRGDIKTPAFMPVGTMGTVKAMLPENVRETGADIILANTYHLMLRPGEQLIHEQGGLHKFMNWERPILTDSGGFQVMSLANLRKISEKGVTFRSQIDGKLFDLTPEKSIHIQKLLGSDIVMCFDECTPYPVSESDANFSMRLSMRWAERSREAFGIRSNAAIFGIVQGSTYKELREESAKKLRNIGFDGFAIGGLAVGEGQEEMLRVLDYTTDWLPDGCPKYLMGVGKPSDIVESVKRGVDMFDCVIPTRSGRTGQALSRQGPINIRNARYARDKSPLDPECECMTCRKYSRAYLHHMHKSKEIISSILLTWHNLHYYQWLMASLRKAIKVKKLVDIS
jgi:queuine tRNA-ribosyltransferase